MTVLPCLHSRLSSAAVASRTVKKPWSAQPKRRNTRTGAEPGTQNAAGANSIEGPLRKRARTQRIMGDSGRRHTAQHSQAHHLPSISNSESDPLPSSRSNPTVRMLASKSNPCSESLNESGSLLKHQHSEKLAKVGQGRDLQLSRDG